MVTNVTISENFPLVAAVETYIIFDWNVSLLLLKGQKQKKA